MGNDEIKYSVWLSESLGAGNCKGIKLLELFGSAEKVYNATDSELLKSRALYKNDINKMRKTTLNAAESIVKDCEINGIDIITVNDSKYPKTLKEIENPPIVLYIKGSLPDFYNIPSISIVGPRKITEFGKRAAYSLSYRLAKAGFTVVSGGALGADTHAHVGAIKAGGVTVLVLGCGIKSHYLQKNEKLREFISENGCLISEYSPDTPASKFTFPIRNRIISGLTLGTVVIEAGEKSGSLITAHHANEQGRDVFVIPGSTESPEYKGSNALLRDGAIAVLNASDIFNEYIPRFPDKIDIKRAYERPILENKPVKSNAEENISKNIVSGLSNNANIVYNCLDKQKFTPDDIVNTGLSDSEIISALVELEMEFLIKALPGGMYELSDK